VILSRLNVSDRTQAAILGLVRGRVHLNPQPAKGSAER
jgi:hypothetical protein